MLDSTALEQDDEERSLLIADRAASGRPMLAVSLAAERDVAVAELWAELSRTDDVELVRELLVHLQRSGAIEEGRRHLLQRSFRARRILNSLPPSRYRDAMDQLTRSF